MNVLYVHFLRERFNFFAANKFPAGADTIRRVKLKPVDNTIHKGLDCTK